MFLLAKEYDNSLNAAKIINIIDAPIKILEDINDKERFLPYSFNPFQKPETGNDSNLLIVFYVQIMPDDFVMQLHRF